MNCPFFSKQCSKTNLINLNNNHPKFSRWGLTLGVLNGLPIAIVKYLTNN